MILDTLEIPQLLELSDPIEVRLLSPEAVLVAVTTLDLPTASATFHFDHHHHETWSALASIVFVPSAAPRRSWYLGDTFRIRHFDTVKITWLGGIT